MKMSNENLQNLTGDIIDIFDDYLYAKGDVKHNDDHNTVIPTTDIKPLSRKIRECIEDYIGDDENE